MTIAERVYQKIKNAPESVALQVLKYIDSLDTPSQATRSSERTMWDFVGILEGSPAFEGDPVDIQRAFRDEWD